MWVTVAVLLMTACTGGVVYDRYQSPAGDGWQRRDTLFFGIPPARDNTYAYIATIFDRNNDTTAGSRTSNPDADKAPRTLHPSLELRIGNDYPYGSLTVIVEQRVTAADRQTTHTIHRDTMECALADNNGRFSNTGVSCHHYSFALEPVTINPDDSLTIAVSHNMRREQIPGIANIGIKAE